ncbi:hypothetical protein H0H92_001517 [Tricholoma furcatifolium]|nr:hypothetical protein H0H92_001517 [Tricholoma furcatifolium]
MSTDESPISATHKRPLYESSTQYKNWRFSPEHLTELRVSLNRAAVDAIRNTLENEKPGSSSVVSFLAADEELLLVKLYLTKITQLCGHFRFPEEVEATAISYLKRFYLKNTVMDWHPKNVMCVIYAISLLKLPNIMTRLTALFLATKTTNNPISLETYTAHIPKTVPSDVLDLEFLVAQSLGFEFAVWHAHRALWGIILDVQNLSDSLSDIKSLYESALAHVRASRLTDAELIYTPSQIAFAALSLTAPELAAQWSDSKFQPNSTSQGLNKETVPELMAGLKSLITSSGHPPDVEAVREVDRRLKLCKNPEKIVGSHAYLAKKAEEEKKAEEKRRKKAAEAAIGEDPFHPDETVTHAPLGLVDYDDEDDEDE